MIPSSDELRAMYREGRVIDTLKAIRSEGMSLKDAQAFLASIATPEDHAAKSAAILSRPDDPWVQSAPGIWEPKSQVDAAKAAEAAAATAKEQP